MAGLGVPPGYTITLAQWANEKPSASIECKKCPRRETFDVPLDDATGTGLAINRAIGGWLAHTCHVRTDMQDVPAGSC